MVRHVQETKTNEQTQPSTVRAAQKKVGPKPGLICQQENTTAEVYCEKCQWTRNKKRRKKSEFKA